MKRVTLCLLALLWTSPLAQQRFSGEALIDQQAAFLSSLSAAPENDDTRFAVGIAQFLRSVEMLGQAWYRYGLESGVGRELGVPLLRLPVGMNPQPETISYQDLRAELEAFRAQLRLTEATLAGLTDRSDPAVLLDLNDVYLDYNANIVKDEGEGLATLVALFNQRLDEATPALELRLDRGDAHWLRGYSHLLMALTEVILAHDSGELFAYTAQLFFPRAEVASDILYRQGDLGGFDDGELVDQLTLLHLALRVPLLEPERLTAALEHARAVTEQSELMWQHILAETDNDREWIPNPDQTPVIGAPVTQEIVNAWLLFVAETRALWQGEKLVPHWRFPEGQGINLPRVFTEAQTFDLVLMIQGANLAQYAENGEVVSAQTLEQIWRVFGGEFIGFALWFN